MAVCPPNFYIISRGKISEKEWPAKRTNPRKWIFELDINPAILKFWFIIPISLVRSVPLKNWSRAQRRPTGYCEWETIFNVCINCRHMFSSNALLLLLVAIPLFQQNKMAFRHDHNRHQRAFTSLITSPPDAVSHSHPSFGDHQHCGSCLAGILWPLFDRTETIKAGPVYKNKTLLRALNYEPHYATHKLTNCFFGCAPLPRSVTF